MQKIGVKTLSIIDTISELAQNETLSLAQLSPPVHKKPTTSTPIITSSSNKDGVNKPISTNNTISSVTTKNELASPISSSSSSMPSSTSSPSSNNFMNGKKLLLSPKKKREELSGRRNEASTNGSSSGHTPDWIREIFDYVRKGNLDKLTMSLQGLESTLIRNISDHLGNNLIHGACLYGHVRLLPFLAQKLGPIDFNGALSDVNSKGFTPATLAVKLGQSDIVEWLVRQSTATNILLGGRTAGEEGGRGTPNSGGGVPPPSTNHSDLPKHSLLHAAAKYGQNELVSWLSDEMIRNEADVDQLDKNGNSPLHVAAKNGNVSTLSTLLHHGANVHLKNDLGLKAADVARISHKGVDAAEFLLLYETSLGVSKEYLTSSQQEENVSSELRDLKTHFKDVLNVSKKLIKERHEICKEFSRILESLNDLQRNISIQLSESERKNINNNHHTDIDSKKLRETIESSVGCIRDKWSHSHRTWFSGNNSADFEHKILKAEEGWSKINKNSESSGPKSSSSSTSSSSSSQDNRYPQRHLRDRLEEIRTSNTTFTSLKIKEHRKLIDSDDDDYEDDGIVDYLSPDEGKTLGLRHRKKLPTPPTSLNGSMEESVYSSLSNEMYSKIGSPPKGGAVLSLSSQGNKVSFDDSKRRKRRSREELRQKLKECALSSESAAVIEVIEPTSSEEEEFKKSMMEMNISWGRLMNGRRGGNGTTSFRGGRHSQKDLSPTKKLLEMGISASSLASPTNVEYLSDRIEETNSSAGSSNRSSVNSLTKKKKSPRPKGSPSVAFSPAPEEHILPDRLDSEDTIKQKKKKAWYEVVSEDETEVPEVDSLATIISRKGASSDEDEEIF